MCAAHPLYTVRDAPCAYPTLNPPGAGAGAGAGAGGGSGRGGAPPPPPPREFAAEQAALQADLEALKARVEGAPPLASEGPTPAEREAAARRRREREAGRAPRGDKAGPSAREWEAHEAAWERFAASDDLVAAAAAVPWPPGGAEGLVARLAENCAGGDPAALRAAFRRASLRWYPVKFAARFGARLPDPAVRAEVLARAQALAQALTADLAALRAGRDPPA